MPGQILHQTSISRCIERVRRQCGQPAREVVSGGGCEGQIEIGQLARPDDFHVREPLMLTRSALERGEAECGGLQRGDRRVERRVQCAFGASLARNDDSIRFAVECGACQFPGGLQPLKGAAGVGKAYGNQGGLCARSHFELHAVARLAGLRLIKITQQAAKRQGGPISGRGCDGQEYDCTGVAGEFGRIQPCAGLAHGHEQGSEGQASRHIS